MEKQIIYLPRGEGRGRKRKGEGPFLPTFPTLSPRGLNTQAEWAIEYHCLSLPTILKGQA